MAQQDVSTNSTSAAKLTSAASSNGRAGSTQAHIGDIVELVKEYAQQETLGPLRGARRWITYGVVGAVLLGLGSAFVVLGLLRMLQNEFSSTFDGKWMSLLPYLCAFVLSLAIIGLAVSRIVKSTLHPKTDS